MNFRLQVHGTPAPQGSKIRTRYGMREASAGLMPWREAIVSEIIRLGWSDYHLSGPLQVEVVFSHKRLASHYGTRKGERYIKADAPKWMASTPDIDKCLRSTFDALTQSGLIEDDKMIVAVQAFQRYSNDGFVGATIIVTPITEGPLTP